MRHLILEHTQKSEPKSAHAHETKAVTLYRAKQGVIVELAQGIVRGKVRNGDESFAIHKTF